MPRLIFAAAAVRDLERLRAFLRPKSPTAARRAGEAILAGVKGLGANPRMGRLVEDLPERYREWPVRFGDAGYVVRYRIDGEDVTILAVRHQREAGLDDPG